MCAYTCECMLTECVFRNVWEEMQTYLKGLVSGWMSDAAAFFLKASSETWLTEGSPRGADESIDFTEVVFSLTTKATASALIPHSCNYCLGGALVTTVQHCKHRGSRIKKTHTPKHNTPLSDKRANRCMVAKFLWLFVLNCTQTQTFYVCENVWKHKWWSLGWTTGWRHVDRILIGV